MKKTIFCLIAALGLFCACDPVEDSKDYEASSVSSDALGGLITFTQTDKDGKTATDGNYFTFTTNPATIVTVYNYRANGEENILAYGNTKGSFNIIPKRGADPNQTFYIRYVNSDGTVTTVDKTYNVYVPSDLTTDMKLMVSNSGSKIWKWDTSLNGGGWGNLGYTPSSGDDFADNGTGTWWSCPPADLTGQLKHSDTGIATGEEDPNAYMVFSDDNTIKTYDATGKQIRSGTFNVTGYTGSRTQTNGVDWSLGTLTTTAGSILFPFKINGGGTKPTNFEILKLTTDQLVLVYADTGTGSWSEATFWRFKSNSDGEGNLTDYSTKSWTWDTAVNGGGWGNLGYTPSTGDDFADNGTGTWFSCAPADLSGQLKHSDTGTATGEEDPNAYMTFDWKNSTIKSYKADGTEIRSGVFKITYNNGTRSKTNGADWSLGNLNTTAGSILFPFKINGGGTKPTDFEILKLTSKQLVLVYADAGTGSWSEATFWRFKKK